MPVPQGLRDPVSFDDLAMKAVRQQNWLEGTDPAPNRRGVRVRTRLKFLEGLRCRGRQDDVLGPQAHYSLGPLRMASRSSCEASGTQSRPLLPSAIIPWSPRKFTAAFKLCLVVECPQSPRLRGVGCGSQGRRPCAGRRARTRSSQVSGWRLVLQILAGEPSRLEPWHSLYACF